MRLLSLSMSESRSAYHYLSLTIHFAILRKQITFLRPHTFAKKQITITFLQQPLNLFSAVHFLRSGSSDIQTILARRPNSSMVYNSQSKSSIPSHTVLKLPIISWLTGLPENLTELSGSDSCRTFSILENSSPRLKTVNITVNTITVNTITVHMVNCFSCR